MMLPRTFRAAVLAAGLLAAGRANAYVKTTGTMCGAFNPSGFCPGGVKKTKAKTAQGHTWSGSETGQPWDDRTVDVFRPAVGGTTRNQLLIFLHGTGGSADGYDTDSTTGQLGFLNQAAALGYHVIAPDWPEGGTSNGTVCGCYRDCYGDWDWIRWVGGSKDGLRIIAEPESITGRVRAILQHRVAHDSASNWSQYLDANQLGGINWSKVVISGHSQGANLTMYFAKHQALAKAIVFAAPDEELSSTIGSGGGNPTMYRYGTETGLGACTPTDPPDPSDWDQADNSEVMAGYIADNNFENFGGSTWANPRSRIYAFNDAFDTVGTWATTFAGLCTIAFQKQHAAGGLDGFVNVSDSNTSGSSWNSLDYHWLTSFFNGESPSQCGNMCTAGNGNPEPCNGHNQVVGTQACQQGSVGEAKRIAVWKYMLTD